MQEIAVKIQELQSQKAAVSGTKCEVYSRVVGYLRPVTLWNEGKKEEFKIRKNYCPCK
ncbi:MAG: anaerobic ribonucleoside-triphosphate reductase [Endomicrobium sp.]|jgi:anaerobic ribonucleoside-triphosphate reductase|nr:anaerobic ribonucleoside-triphosphate reductase [Endomicrobium sp.]